MQHLFQISDITSTVPADAGMEARERIWLCSMSTCRTSSLCRALRGEVELSGHTQGKKALTILRGLLQRGDRQQPSGVLKPQGP